jgi:hypothetical protein
MPPKKTPTSSLPGSCAAYFLSLCLTTVTATVVDLFVKRVFYRTLARIREVGSGGTSPETSTAHRSPANQLPLEIVEIIVAYLRYDTRSLRACTMTCYSWYIAAVPHLHHTLTISSIRWGGRKSRWPNPIRYMYMLGLLPLVEEFRVHGGCDRFSKGHLNYCILRQFSALANVQELDIERLDISSFMPRIQRYFSHFSPTVRSLVLRKPSGSSRQIIYFIGLFQHLQDLEIYDSLSYLESAGDPTPAPVFVPPLRGWLKLVSFSRTGFLEDMIDLFGGIRFRYMYLYEVYEVRLLLDACANTLESVVLDPTDPLGE